MVDVILQDLATLVLSKQLPIKITIYEMSVHCHNILEVDPSSFRHTISYGQIFMAVLNLCRAFFQVVVEYFDDQFINHPGCQQDTNYVTLEFIRAW